MMNSDAKSVGNVDSIVPNGHGLSKENNNLQPVLNVKSMTNTNKNGSVNINIPEDEESNYTDILQKKSQDEILKWFDQKNLGE